MKLLHLYFYKVKQKERRKLLAKVENIMPSPTSQPIIETKALNKYFYDPEKVQVLNQVNLQLFRNEFTCLIGASGSGKSTLLYLLSTLDTEYEGEIWLDGQNLSSLNKNQLAALRNEKIGFVFQFHYLLPEFTVLENVKLPALKLNKFSEEEIEQKALQKLDMLGLRDQAIKKASKLSGGQQQRVAIARALINNPQIIFGDEPTGNLDSKNTQNVLSILHALKSEWQQSIMVVTHDLNFANDSDRVITFKDGAIVEDRRN